MNDQQTGSDMSGAAMAAYVVLSMEERAASQVLRHMDESSIGALSSAMAAMRRPPRETAYQIYARLMTELDSRGAMAPGGFDAFKKLLSKAFGDKKASDMMDRISRSSSAKLDILSKVDPKSLADQIKGERPQLIAVILGQMTRSAAVECLMSFDEELATDLIYRYAKLDTVQSFALTELRSMLSEHLGGHVAMKSRLMGGVRQAADLLNGMSTSASDRTLGQIRDVDPELADQIRENMFTFEDLLDLPDNFLQAVIFELNPDMRAPALRGASPRALERFVANISRKDAEILMDDIQNGPMVTRADSQAAQHEFVEAALRLANEGRISIRNDEDMI